MPIRNNESFKTHFLGDTKEEANTLLKEYSNTVKLLANKAANVTGVDKDDLYQEGLIGLARARRDFDEERSDKFSIFAIYKIKDAMREYITTQAINIKIPQYIKDAIRIANMLREELVQAGEYAYSSLCTLWDESEKYNNDNTKLGQAIQQTRQVLKGLAERSHTSVKQLLDRAEMTPSNTVEIVDHNITNVVEESISNILTGKLTIIEAIQWLKDSISKEEYQLLWNRYAEGMTVRELSLIMGISAPHVSDKTQQILQKIRKLRKPQENKGVTYNENSANSKEIEQRHAS